MRKFKYFLQRGYGNRFKEKQIEISAENGIEAGKQIETNFPDWEVSMFWEIYPKIKREILWTPWGMREYVF